MPMEIDYGHMWDDLKEVLKTKYTWRPYEVIGLMEKMERDRTKSLTELIKTRLERGYE